MLARRNGQVDNMKTFALAVGFFIVGSCLLGPLGGLMLGFFVILHKITRIVDADMFGG